MVLIRVRAAVAALAAIVIAGVLAVPAQAAVGDIVTVTGTVTDSAGVPMAALDLVVYYDSGAVAVSTGDDGVYSVDLTLIADQTWVSVRPASWISGVECDSSLITPGPALVTINCAIPNYVYVTVSGVGHTDNGTSPGGQMVTLASTDNWYLGGGIMADDGSFNFTARLRDNVTEFYVVGPDGARVGPFGPVADGAEFAGIEFTFHPFVAPVDVDMIVQGRVLDKKGHPVAGADVVIDGGSTSVHALTDAQGFYTATGAYPWSEDFPVAQPVWVVVDGVYVDWVDTLSPDVPVTVNYRVGKSPVFEPFALGLELTAWGSITDVYRKVDANNNAEWRVCTDSWCYGFAFGTKSSAIYEVLPLNDGAGVAPVLLRDVRAGVSQWRLFSPDDVYPQTATFGPKKLDGLSYFDFTGSGGYSVVAWADKNGETTVWSWGVGDSVDDVQTIVVPGKLVSAEHRNLDGAGGDEMVLVTRSGNNYTVSLLGSATAAPVQVATGRGAPTVTYDDADGDGVFDIVTTYPDRTTHRHHCK